MERCTAFAEKRYVILQDSAQPVEILGMAENGTPVKITAYFSSMSGDHVDRLGRYEDIHPDPEYLREVFDCYCRLAENSCFECDLHGTKDCKYPPKWGQNIRINCPFFRHQLSIEEGELTD